GCSHCYYFVRSGMYILFSLPLPPGPVSCLCPPCVLFFFFFFFNDAAPTEIYTFPYTTLFRSLVRHRGADFGGGRGAAPFASFRTDRKSTRLNSSHGSISYAVFCLKKKKKQNKNV